MPRHLLVSLAVIGAAELLQVSCFSARLPRPWEPPRTTCTSRTRRRRKWWEASSLQSTPVSSQNKDSDNDASGDNSSTDDEETIFLNNRVNNATRPTIPSQSPTIVHASFAESTKKADQPTVRSCFRLLFGMTRPSNFLGVVLFHVLGVYLALETPNVRDAQLLCTLAHPSMFVVLLSLLLTSATSMVVNDYFDYQLGNDAHKMNKPLVGGTVPIAVAKRFLYILYSALLLCLPFVPGVPTRVMVVVGMMLTYQYTRHIKPITWLKNIVCASLIALSPATSGSAAYSLSSNKSWWLLFGVPTLWRLVGMIFLGFVGREILMDINDVADDSAHDVRTVPVEFGRKFAARAALSCTAAMTVAATVGPIWQIRQVVGSSLTWTILLSTLRTSPAARKLLLASIGSLAMMRRAWHVYKTEGEDRDIVDRAIEEGKLSVMLLLASFV